MIEFIPSAKGGRLMSFGGYLYRKNRVVGQKTYWKCCLHNDKVVQCRGNAIFELVDEVEKLRSSTLHNHAPDPETRETKIAVSHLKEKARSTQNKPCQLINDLKIGLDQDINLPSDRALAKIIYRTRKIEIAEPTPLDFELDEGYKRLDIGENFLISDLRADGRNIIFGTLQSLQILARSTMWIMDGTFKTCPSLFSQIYSIHGVIKTDSSTVCIPCIYMLMSSKSESSYKTVFQEILVAAQSYGVILKPRFIMTDFETGAINACKSIFRPQKHRCCFFHFGQIVFRKVQELGLKSRYAKDIGFSLSIKKLVALAFLEAHEIYRAFEECRALTDVPEIIAFLDENYINGKIVGYRSNGIPMRSPPRYPPALWTVSDLVSSELPRTQNFIEGWHNRLANLTGAHHIPVYRFIDAIKKESHTSALNFNNFIRGISKPIDKKYRDREERIKRVLRNRNVLSYQEFLYGIACNLSL